MSTLRNIYSALKDQPLFLPKGSIRALIAMGTVAVWLAMEWQQVEVSKQFYALLGYVIASYFAGRNNDGERDVLVRRLENERRLFLEGKVGAKPGEGSKG